MSEQFLPGFAIYLALVFVPGLGLGEFLGIWARFGSLGQRIAVSFGLGLVVDTVVFVSRAYGPLLLGLRTGGVDLPTMTFLLLLGSTLLVSCIIKNRTFRFLMRPELPDLALFCTILSVAVILGFYFVKFPIFPEFQSGDYTVHVLYAEQIASGSMPVANGFLYYGVHFQLASAILLVGGEGLVTSRETIAILVALSPLLFFLAATVLFDSEKVGVLAATIYSFSGTIWFVSVFDSGLYANFFGILATLFFIVSAKSLIDYPKSKLSWFIFVMALASAYISHYSTVSIIPALLLLPLIQFWRERRVVYHYLWPALVSITPLVVAIALRPRFLKGLINLALVGGGSVSKTTFLSNVLSIFPVMSYMASEVTDDIEFVALIIFAIVSVYSSVKSKRIVSLIPLFWFLSLIIAAPLDISSWRFSVEALIPITLMASLGIFEIASRLKSMFVSHRKMLDIKLVIITLMLLLPIVYGSWGQRALVDSQLNVGATSQIQKEILETINWLGNNTPSNSTYLSLTDWRMTYTALMINRPTYFHYFSDQNQTVQYADKIGAEYVIVTRQATLELPSIQEFQPWYSFSSEPGFREIFSNADVRIYQVS